MSFAGPGDLFLIAEEFNYKINKSHDIVKWNKWYFIRF
jgi:hypothetical protein